MQCLVCRNRCTRLGLCLWLFLLCFGVVFYFHNWDQNCHNLGWHKHIAGRLEAVVSAESAATALAFRLAEPAAVLAAVFANSAGALADD